MIVQHYLYQKESHMAGLKGCNRKRVRQLGEMSQIGRRVYPHLIRHTTATDGLFRGMPVEEVQKLLGHVNITTTMIYAEVSEENTKMIIRNISYKGKQLPKELL